MAQTPDSNPFSILGLPTRFDLDELAIQRAYLACLSSAHPDAVPTGDDEIASDAAELNKARMVLLDREQRASALLALFEGPSASQCKQLPDGFLMEMMTRRQEIEEQIADGGDASRSNWELWARDERARYTKDAQTLFDSLAEHSDAEKLVEIRTLLNAWRYIERLIEQLDPGYNPENADFR